MALASVPVFENISENETSVIVSTIFGNPFFNRQLDNESQTFFLAMIESRQVALFRAKLLRTGGTSSAAMLAVGGLAGSLPQIFSYLNNLGIPSSPSDGTLVLSSLIVRSGESARKTASPAGEAQ